jgi:putative DNA primase/helicase
MSAAADLAAVLNARPTGRGWVARCPAHDDRTPSLSIRETHEGRVLLKCFAGCSWADLRDALDPRRLWRSSAGDSGWPERKRWQAREHHPERLQVVRRIWHAAKPITPDDPADRYLRSRGLEVLRPPTLRFLSCTRHPSGAFVSALVAAACRWPERRVVAVQLTALRGNGRKAVVEPVRWTRGRLGGAAVRLTPWVQATPIVIVEGVEDGLAVACALPRAAAWAALGAGNAAAIVLPPGAMVILALDGDDSGRAAASGASAALLRRGHRVRIARVPDGQDLNDILIGDARALAA